MEEVIKRVEEIFRLFLQEERGNRLSQFAVIALRELVVKEIKDYTLKKNDTPKKDDTPKKK